MPFGEAARGDEERVVNVRLSYIDNLLDQARESLSAGANARWISSAADAFTTQLNSMSGAVETLQTAVDGTRGKFATLQQTAAEATQLHMALSAQVGFQPVPQGWHG